MYPIVNIYSDESGVFDKIHKDYFVYVGIAVIGQDTTSILAREYLAAEKNLRKANKYKELPELKASLLDNSDKRKLYRIIDNQYKFIVLINLKKLQDELFETRHSQQRYLDYAYKRGLKYLLLKMGRNGAINLSEEFEIRCYLDERNHASNGKYTLRDSILTEFKTGMYVHGFDIKPIARKLVNVTTAYCNSEITTLVRASDILANRALFEAQQNNVYKLADNYTSILTLP